MSRGRGVRKDNRSNADHDNSARHVRLYARDASLTNGAMDAEPGELRAALERALSLIPGQSAPISLAAVLERYIASKRPTWKPNSKRKFERIFRDCWSRYGCMSVGEISAEFAAQVLADAHTPSAQRERLAFLAAAWRWANANGMISRALPWSAKGPAAKARDRWLEPPELARFWDALETLERRTIHPGSFRALRLIAWTACRISEVCELESARVDLRLGLFRLRDSKTGPRDVPVAPRVVAYLRACNLGKWVCPSSTGDSHVRQQRVGVDLARVCDLAKLSDVSPHTLRHTWATNALLAGVPLEHVRIALGHSTAFMTSRYGHLTATHVRASIDKATETVAKRS